MMRRRKLFEDILDDIEARSANAKQKLIDDSEENEIDPYDVCTDMNEDLDVRQWDVVFSFQMSNRVFDLDFRDIRNAFGIETMNLLYLLDSNRYVDGYSKILWSSATMNAHFCDYDVQDFRVDSKRAAIAVGIKLKNDQLNYRACLSFIIAMFKSFWFTKSRKFTTKSFLEIEMQIFTKRTFLMDVPYVQDEFRDILMTNPQEDKRYKRSWDKIFNAVNFLCKLWVAKTFSNKAEQKDAYIRALNGIDLKNKLKRNKDKE